MKKHCFICYSHPAGCLYTDYLRFAAVLDKKEALNQAEIPESKK